MIHMAYTKAKDILVTNKPQLVQLSEYLIEHETITGDNLGRLFEEGGLGGDEPGTPGYTA